MTSDRRALLNEALTALDWSEPELSRRSGVSQPAINRFRAGKTDMSEANWGKATAAIEAGLLADTAALEAELKAKEKVKVRLTPQMAERIRARANARMERNFHTDEIAFLRDWVARLERRISELEGRL